MSSLDQEINRQQDDFINYLRKQEKEELDKITENQKSFDTQRRCWIIFVVIVLILVLSIITQTTLLVFY